MGLRGRFFLVLLLTISFSSAGAVEKWREVVSLEGSWMFSIGDNRKWADPAFNDRDWEHIRVPGKWEDQGFNGYNGYAWYRKSFDGTVLRDRKTTYSLFMGYVDDVDEIYLNGHLIGSSGSFPPRYQTAYNAKRVYFIPAEFINFNGRNTVAVRVYDAEIEGGIIKGEIGIFTDDDEKQMALNLRGAWEFKALHKRPMPSMSVTRNRERHVPPDEGKWTSTNVPAYWEHQGFDNYDGAAWYRKQFTIPKDLEGEDLVLILGKVDDYDEVYLNGNLVGSTNKYDKLRVYNIPSDSFRAGAINLLLVYVEDYGMMGGIYEGPIGLIRASELTRFMRWRN